MNQEVREVLMYVGFIVEVFLFIFAGMNFLKKEWFYVITLLGIVVAVWVGKLIAKHSEIKTLERMK